MAGVYASGPPNGVAVTVKHPKVIGLKWNAVSNATGYTVQYGHHPGHLNQTQSFDGPEATIGNLQPGRPYFFRVQANPSRTAGPYSEIIQAHTPGLG